MDKIGTVLPKVLARAENPTAPLPATLPAARPALVDPEADSFIPQRVWSNWIPAQGARSIRRELTGSERAAVRRRQYDLQCGMLPFQPHERDIVRAALHAMLGGFRSLRERDDNAETAVEVLLVVLREFPGWAIEEACLRIAQRRTELDPPLDPRWPPSDGQVHAVVSMVVKPYWQSLAASTALLAAPVAEPEPPRPAVQHDWHVFAWRRQGFRCDGKHAQRVAADIDARRATHEGQAA